MKISLRSIPVWAVLPVVLAIETVLCAVLGAAILDVFVRRPLVGGGSITTLLPGFVYASATVMKVCLVSTLVSLVAGLAWRLWVGRAPDRANPGMPAWGVASAALMASTPLIGALAVLGVQTALHTQEAISADHFSRVARSGVLVMLAIILAGALAAVISLARRERPSLVPIVGLVANVVLAGLFWYLRFHAPGFDQDRWAPR